MKQETLIRLFKSIESDSSDDLMKMAYKIIDEEVEKGHYILSEKLKKILENRTRKDKHLKRELSNIFQPKIPENTRIKSQLAITVDRDFLRHDMILPESIESKFNRIEKEFIARDRLAHHGLKPRQKILFYGAPGCGKSMGAERIAWNTGLPFVKVRFDAMISSYLGESLSNLRKIFEELSSQPCVLLLDEFDIIAKSRTFGQDVGEMYRIVNMLLYLLEEYNSPSGLLIATTNLEKSLDKAIFRRFDEIIEISKPGTEEIIRLLKQTLLSQRCDKTISWSNIASEMEGFSAALVVKVAQNAAKLAILNNTGQIGINEIKSALGEVEQHGG
ncbi:MAG: ATP-binding protein [Imperialibacter sp.]|uniref:AAA family ATPase n=1 Tax=Imperialibacter sp. TaxID=2038411 RepID=UPI0032EC5CB2